MTQVAIDTGGTFTDLVYLDGEILKSKKIFSTPKNPSQAIFHILSDFNLKSIEILIHGSTVATNTFLERKGAKTAFITTYGFEDLLFIGRQARPKLYDFFVEKPRPFISKENILGVRERIGPKGEIIKSLETEEIKEVIKFIKRKRH